jgi:predicted ATPase
MIQKASFRNFKSLRHVDVELERLTVFVGPNASGKTSILEGLYHLSRCALIEPKEVFIGSISANDTGSSRFGLRPTGAASPRLVDTAMAKRTT